MTKFTKLGAVLTIVAALSVSACAKQKFIMQGGIGQTAESSFSHFFISGVFQTDRIDASRICGGVDKVVHVEAQLTFLNWLVSVPTFGIYSPRQHRVICRR